MVKRLLTLVFGLSLALAQPAFATPQGDAQLIANKLVTSPDFKAKLHEMGVKACADKLSSMLAARSVKIKDRDKLVSLLADCVPDALYDRLQTGAAARLAQNWKPEDLALLADYLQNPPPDAAQGSSDTSATNGIKLEDLPQEILALQGDDRFRAKLALTNAAVTIIFLATQEIPKLENDLTGPQIADLLAVNGVFSFANPIVRKNVIRDLRAGNP